MTENTNFIHIWASSVKLIYLVAARLKPYNFWNLINTYIKFIQSFFRLSQFEAASYTVRPRHKNQFSFSFRMHIFWPAIFFRVYLKDVLGMQSKPPNDLRETPSIYSQNSKCNATIQVTCSIASKHKLGMYSACIFLVNFPRWKNKIAEFYDRRVHKKGLKFIYFRLLLYWFIYFIRGFELTIYKHKIQTYFIRMASS